MFSELRLILRLLILATILSGCTIDAKFTSSSLESSISPPTSIIPPGFGINGLAKLKFGSLGYSEDSDVQSIKIQSDNKVVMIGYATTSPTSNEDFTLVRLNADGSLDTTFGGDGIVSWDPGHDSFDWAWDLDFQADGKIVASGDCPDPSNGLASFCVVRFKSDGSIDTSFGTNGASYTRITGITNMDASKIKVLSSGKILVAGKGSNPTYGQALIFRLNSDGSLDTTFNAGLGYNIITNESSHTFVYSLELDTSGNIILSGSNTAGSYQSFVAKILSTGVSDTSFNGTGYVLSNRSAAQDTLKAAFPQADGSILVFGTYSGANDDIYMSRYLSNGTIDATFNGTGIARFDFGGNEIAAGAIFNKSGNFTIAIRTNADDMHAIEVSPTGVLNTSYGVSGLASADITGNTIYDIAYTIAEDSNGNTVVAGYSYPGSSQDDFSAARFTPTGALDSTFSGDGKWILDIQADRFDYPVSLQVDNSGSIFVAGYTEKYNDRGLAAAKLDTTGAFVTSYGSQGKAVVFDPSFYPIITKSKLLPSGQLLFIGKASNNFFMTRLNADGSLDTTFNGGTGYTNTDFAGVTDTPYDILIQSDGKIILIGSAGNNIGIARYNSDGTLDTTFNSTGKSAINTGATSTCKSAVLLSGGDIVCAGYRGNDFLLAKITSGGALDTSFNTTGYVLTDFNSGADKAQHILIDSNNKFVVTGTSNASSNQDFAVARFNNDGSLDTSFGISGKVTYNFNGTSTEDTVGAGLQSDGKIIIFGTTTTSSVSHLLHIRLNTDGTVDNSFGTATYILENLNNEASVQTTTSFHILPDDSFYVLAQQDLDRQKAVLAKYNKDGLRP